MWLIRYVSVLLTPEQSRPFKKQSLGAGGAALHFKGCKFGPLLMVAVILGMFFCKHQTFLFLFG